VDALQTEAFLDAFEGFRVMPWIGGAWGVQAFPDDAAWRETFAQSVRDLLVAHPRLAGIHVNIEPCPSGNEHFLKTLQALRATLPAGKLLSVAAYPPPTIWQHSSSVHWDEPYFRNVSRQADQMVVMMYDTSIRFGKVYRSLMADWTRESLDRAGKTDVLLAVPAYEDAGVGYHDPRVENLDNALLGIHAGLLRHGSFPANYQGVALYCEWEMDSAKWATFAQQFVRRP